MQWVSLCTVESLRVFEGDEFLEISDGVLNPDLTTRQDM